MTAPAPSPNPTSVFSLLAEAERHGVVLALVGNRVMWDAPTPPPRDLLRRLHGQYRRVAVELGRRQGKRTDKELPVSSPEVPKNGQETRAYAAERAGLGERGHQLNRLLAIIAKFNRK